MENQLYTVTLTDLGTYTAQVVANSPEAAAAIAKEQLWNALVKPTGFKITKRETDADAYIAKHQPHLLHSVTTWYRMKCAKLIPATTEAEAKEHFRRLLELDGPVHCATGDEIMGDIIVEQSLPNGGPTNA